MSLPSKLLYLRKKMNLSQEDLACKINVTRQTISNWENGKSIPDAYQLISLAKALNISLDQLTNDIGKDEIK